MADLEQLSWREKLEILRKMPKPHGYGGHNGKQLSKVLVQKSSKTHTKPLSDEYMRLKLLEYSEKCKKLRLKKQNEIGIKFCINNLDTVFASKNCDRVTH